ncbi:hypothetical protein GE09DRAFT_158193 [Coniochaeta sp. 2T2.1]|nr:hypothetical protein GE09DRAFT_158193 [Coniochaeta sp. 2T2.1]
MAGHDTQPPPLPTTPDPLHPNIQQWPDLGLTLIHDFISPAEEEAMIVAFHAVDPLTKKPTTGRKRLSQHFGYHFDYTTFGASDSHFTPVPSYITDFVIPRLPVRDYPPPDQFTVQYYPPGAGIPPHVDTHSMFEEALYSLSFGSAVPMVFRRCGANDARKMRLPKRSLLVSTGSSDSGSNEANSPAAEKIPDHEHPSWELLLPRRSLLVMTGPSRYGYTHGIKARKTDVVDGRPVLREGRYSITMRTTRRGEAVRCDCDFPGVCDARIREEATDARKKSAA